MAYGSINIDTITGSGASSVIVNNGTNNVAGFTTGNNIQLLQNGGGIVFSNSSATTNSTLNDYETGTWTPTDGSGAGLTFTINNSTYTKIGNTVFIELDITYPSNSNGTNAAINGLPFTVNVSGSWIPGYNTLGTLNTWWFSGGTSQIACYTSTNANLSAKRMIGGGFYRANF